MEVDDFGCVARQTDEQSLHALLEVAAVTLVDASRLSGCERVPWSSTSQNAPSTDLHAGSGTGSVTHDAEQACWSANLALFDVARRRASKSYDKDVLELFIQAATLEAEYGQAMQRLPLQVVGEDTDDSADPGKVGLVSAWADAVRGSRPLARNMQYYTTQAAWGTLVQCLQGQAQAHCDAARHLNNLVIPALRASVSAVAARREKLLGDSASASEEVLSARREAQVAAADYGAQLRGFTHPKAAAAALRAAACKCCELVRRANAATLSFERERGPRLLRQLQQLEEERLGAVHQAFRSFAQLCAGSASWRALETSPLFCAAADALSVKDAMAAAVHTHGVGRAEASYADELMPPPLCAELAALGLPETAPNLMQRAFTSLSEPSAAPRNARNDAQRATRCDALTAPTVPSATTAENGSNNDSWVGVVLNKLWTQGGSVVTSMAAPAAALDYENQRNNGGLGHAQAGLVVDGQPMKEGAGESAGESAGERAQKSAANGSANGPGAGALRFFGPHCRPHCAYTGDGALHSVDRKLPVEVEAALGQLTLAQLFDGDDETGGDVTDGVAEDVSDGVTNSLKCRHETGCIAELETQGLQSLGDAKSANCGGFSHGVSAPAPAADVRAIGAACDAPACFQRVEHRPSCRSDEAVRSAHAAGGGTSSAEWFYRPSAKESARGPFTWEQLLQEARSGRLSSSGLARRSTHAAWVPAETVPALIVPTLPPPPPPPPPQPSQPPPPPPPYTTSGTQPAAALQRARASQARTSVQTLPAWRAGNELNVESAEAAPTLLSLSWLLGRDGGNQTSASNDDNWDRNPRGLAATEHIACI